VLPQCGLCTRMGRMCDYSEAQPAPTADDLANLQSKLAELENKLHVSSPSPNNPNKTKEPLWMPAPNNFPSLLFLDIDQFKCENMTVSKPQVEIPVVRTSSAHVCLIPFTAN
jgi:hypothetical protein